MTFLLTILFGTVAGYIIFNSNNIGWNVILTCLKSITIDYFILRVVLCFFYAVLQMIRYTFTRNQKFKNEINLEVTWELTQ